MSNIGKHNDQGMASEEDGPEYRSVMIQPLAAPAMERLFSPLEKVGKSSVGYGNSYSKSEDKHASSPPSSYRWGLQKLPELPADYTLVRTNVYVKNSSVQSVVDRITKELRASSLSIDSKGTDNEVCFISYKYLCQIRLGRYECIMNLTECVTYFCYYFLQQNSLLVETPNGTKLVISLFGQNEMIVVEVRRHSGCSFQFRDAAKSILRASKGLNKQQIPLSSRKFSIPLALPKRCIEAQRECVRDDFEISYKMLLSEKVDAHLLALENMGKMTSGTNDGTRDVAAKLVLSNRDCLKRILSLVDIYNKDRSMLGMESCYNSILCRKILEVLSNSCEAINKCDLADILSTTNHDLKSRSFLSLLLTSLHEASSRPHDAFQAARCMRCLLVSKEVESLLVEMSVFDAISSAHNVGLTFHQDLERESNQLMGKLQGVC